MQDRQIGLAVISPCPCSRCRQNVSKASCRCGKFVSWFSESWQKIQMAYQDEFMKGEKEDGQEEID